MCVNRPHRYPGHRQTPEEGMKHRKCWSKSIGERGARVRLYEDHPGGPLFRSVYIKGKEKRKSLGHRDQELAITQAYELLHSLRTNQQALDQETLTIGMAAQLYLEPSAPEQEAA